MKCLGIITLLLTCCEGTFPQVERGTTILINETDSKIMVAADSRGLHGNLPPDDCECQIAALGKYTIYAAEGAANYTWPGDSQYSWKSVDVAREAYRSLISQEGTPDFVRLVAKEWGRRLVDHWSLLYKRSPQEVLRSVQAKDGGLIRAFFGGTDPKGTKLVALFTNISVDEKRVPVIVATEPTEGPNFVPLGFNEIVMEFFLGGTERARLEQSSWPKIIGSSPDSDIWETARYVQLEITYHIPKGGPSAVSEVGGSVDALVLPKGKTVRWFQRKSNCPAE